MANFHLHAKMISRVCGKSAVAKLGYRSATKLVDQATGLTHNYINKPHVTHVSILHPDDAPVWITDIAKECETSRQTAIQKLSDICEGHEKRKDSQVYREVEFSLPNELTDEQNIAWAEAFVKEVFCKRGMVAVCNFHFDVDPDTGLATPHCHTLLTTRPLTDSGFGLKNREWNDEKLIEEAREQCAAYQNAALKEHGFDVRVTHLSYEDRQIDIEGQPKLKAGVREMTKRGISTQTQERFNFVKLANQFKILKNPEMVFEIITSKQSIFTRTDVAKVLNRSIDDHQQFKILLDRLMASPELVPLDGKTSRLANAPAQRTVSGEVESECAYTTKSLLRLEVDLTKTAETLSVQQTHEVSSGHVEDAIATQNEKLRRYRGLTVDQHTAINHMLNPNQLSCVVGYAGSGKTTCLEAATQAWQASGFKVLGLAPTGKAAVNMESGVPRAMTLHKFLLQYEQGRERVSRKTVLVLDEAGMVGSRLFYQLLAVVVRRGAKLVIMGDNNQLQPIEAGPALRLLLSRIKAVVLDTIVRQQDPLHKEATRLFGMLQTDRALECYKDHFVMVKEPLPNFNHSQHVLDNYCLARQISGRIWQEMSSEKVVTSHQDYALYQTWRDRRESVVETIIQDYASLEPELHQRGVDVEQLKPLVQAYQDNPDLSIFKSIETILRKFSLTNLVDTRVATREALVAAWTKDLGQNPTKSHIMLSHTTKDAHQLNQLARTHARKIGIITGPDHAILTQSFEKDDFGKDLITQETLSLAQGDRLLFTKSDTTLKVKNGTLATIEAITPNKITVILDETGERLSFSPHRYPFITSGWATTINKAQGANVDCTHLLASYGQYRNVTYVGMTRHRDSVKLYASTLDFWRPDKIIDRLSRAQEKLSGMDYLTMEQIETLLQEDSHILWHEAKLLQVKDLWTAIKVGAKQLTGFGNQASGIQESGIQGSGIRIQESESASQESVSREDLTLEPQHLTPELRHPTSVSPASRRCLGLLKDLTTQNATFSEQDAHKLIRNRFQSDPEHVFKQVMENAIQVGESITGGLRYTSVEYQETETRLLAGLETLAQRSSTLSIDGGAVEALLEEKYSYFNDQQKQALRNLCSDKAWGVLIGRAGSGKTTVLKPVVELHKQAGYEVVGMALSACAASVLGEEALVKSDTLAFYLDKWKKYDQAKEELRMTQDAWETEKLTNTIASLEHYQLHERSLVILDEAGMVGTRQWAALVDKIIQANAKVHNAGDDHQFKAIESGDVLRKTVDLAGQHACLSTVETVIRQKVEWMQKASEQFANLETASALSVYENHGKVHELDTHEALYEALADRYLEKLSQDTQANHLVLAYTREACAQLNQAIRKRLQGAGLLSHEQVRIHAKDWSRDWSVGDRIIFLENDRYQRAITPVAGDSAFAVKKGTMGTVVGLDPVVEQEDKHTYRFTVDVGKETQVSFLVHDYKDFNHAYALTEHKSQGQTVVWALIAACRFMDAYALYVAMTRHRDDAELFYSKQDFPSFKDLQLRLGRVSDKDLVCDYTIPEEDKEAWHRVQDYKSIEQKRIALLVQAKKEGVVPNWETHNQLVKERQEVGRIILEDREGHRNFVRQARLTFEHMEIMCGLKQRPLSRAEQQAQETTQLYVAAAIQARDLWKTIRHTHPGLVARTHPEYEAYADKHQERDRLASVMAQAMDLHGPFIKETFQTLGYGQGTIFRQAQAFQRRELARSLLNTCLSHQEERGIHRLLHYVEARDQAAQAWGKVEASRAKHQALGEGQLTLDTCSLTPDQELALFTQTCRDRDKLALAITRTFENHVKLCAALNIILDVDKLFKQADQGLRDSCITHYQHSDSLLAKNLGAHVLYTTWQEEKTGGVKKTIAGILQAGIPISELHTHAKAHEAHLFALTLNSDAERDLFSALTDYDQAQDKARAVYRTCAKEAKAQNIKLWETPHYSDCTSAGQRRDILAHALIKYPHDQICAIAEALSLSLDVLDKDAHRGEVHHYLQLYTHTDSPLVKSLIAAELQEFIQIEKEMENETEKGLKLTIALILQAGISLPKLKAQGDAFKKQELLSQTPESRQQIEDLMDYKQRQEAVRAAYRQCKIDLEDKKTGDKPWHSSGYQDFVHGGRHRNVLSRSLLQDHAYLELEPLAQKMRIPLESLDKEAHLADLQDLADIFQGGSPSQQYLAAQELKVWLAIDEGAKNPGERYTYRVLRENGLYPKDLEVPEVRGRESADSHQSPVISQQQVSAKNYRLKTEQLSPDEVKERLKERTADLAETLFGKPSSKGKNAWRYGRHKSKQAFVAGPKQGLLSDFESGVYGDGLRMIQEKMGLDRNGALKWAREWLGDSRQLSVVSHRQQVSADDSQLNTATWTPVFPVPETAPVPNLKGKGLAYQLDRFQRQETHRFTYCNETGQLMGYVVRLENQQGSKVTLPLTYCENDKEIKAWRWQGFGKDRPLYGLDQLMQHPDKPVLLVEGEKAADAAKELLPDYVVMSWQGGAAAAKSSDWTPLADKQITIWPDNDEAGHKAAATIQSILPQVRCVTLPEDTPAKWDLADPMPVTWTKATIDRCLGNCHEELLTKIEEVEDLRTESKTHEASREERALSDVSGRPKQDSEIRSQGAAWTSVSPQVSGIRIQKSEFRNISAPKGLSDQIERLTTKIKVVNDKYDLVDVHAPEPEQVQMFIERTAAYLKSMGVEESGIFERSCHMLSNLEEVNERTSYEMRDVAHDQNHALRVCVVAARIWHERTVDKTKPYQNPLEAAIAEVKKHVQEQHALVSRLQNRYAEHLSPDKVVPIADHAIRVQEATGEALHDFKIHELACKVDANTLPHEEEIHHLGETARVLSFQLQVPKGWSREVYTDYLKTLTPKDYSLFTQMHEISNKHGLTPAMLPDKERMHTFMHQSSNHLQAMGIGEDAAFAMSCHMLNNLDKTGDPRVSVLAAHLWRTDKPHSYQDHIFLAEKMVKDYDAMSKADTERFETPHSEHPLALLKTLDAHHEQTHQLQEIMKTVSLRLQQQRMLQVQRDHGHGLER